MFISSSFDCTVRAWDTNSLQVTTILGWCDSDGNDSDRCLVMIGVMAPNDAGQSPSEPLILVKLFGGGDVI